MKRLCATFTLAARRCDCRLSAPGTKQNFLAWLRPLLGWWLFWGAMLAVFLGLSVLLIPQWVRHEKLSFPLARFPLYLTDKSLYRSRLFWWGFAVIVAFRLQACVREHPQ